MLGVLSTLTNVGRDFSFINQCTDTPISYSHQSVTIDPFAFVHPQEHKLLRRFELVWLCHKQTLEDVAEMPDVELVVEICCCLSEIGSDLFKPVNAVY